MSGKETKGLKNLATVSALCHEDARRNLREFSLQIEGDSIIVPSLSSLISNEVSRRSLIDVIAGTELPMSKMSST